MTVQLPETISLDLDDLTLGELEDIEELTGMSIAAISTANQDGDTPTRVLRAMAFVVLRRTIPEVTFEDCRAIRPSMIAGRRDVQPDPTPSPDADGAQ
jgi:hypothetical protein